MTKVEIRVLQGMAAEIYRHFKNHSTVYVRSGQEIFEANREEHDDAFLASCVADEYWWKFEWYLKDSDLWKDTESDDIDKVVERFKERFVEFFQKG